MYDSKLVVLISEYLMILAVLESSNEQRHGGVEVALEAALHLVYECTHCHEGL